MCVCVCVCMCVCVSVCVCVCVGVGVGVYLNGKRDNQQIVIPSEMWNRVVAAPD